MKLLLRNGRVVDPAASVDEALDVLVEDGKIARIEPKIAARGADVLDVAGLVVCPGFIDLHVHLREPGQEWKETVATGTAAAAAGGFAGVACMPNTVPPNDNRSVTEFILAQASAGAASRVYPIGCVTKAQKGEELAEMGDMVAAGARAFSDDGCPVASSLLMRRALEYSRIFDLPIIDHCEDSVLAAGGVVHEGEVSTRLGLRGWPGVAEDLMVQRDLLLAEYTGGHVHIAHLSTARGAEFVRRAKKAKVAATCEVTPHHLVLTDAAVADYDTDAKMNPPLRSEADRRALLKALADGTVDAIATDHAPHHVDEKAVEFSRAPFGIVGLETAVSLCLDRLVHAGVIGLSRLVELFTAGPARILRLDRGTLRPGKDADLTVLDLQRQVVVDPAKFRSKSRNTPFAGWSLRGAAVMTVVGGRIVHDAR
ncbi:MAG: dihydroorotase [Acidobacteriia bacterium]|nr:dihydroorotase [Terriglobia bacterium]